MDPNTHGPLPARLATLLSAAVRTPSLDNTQPWRFTVDTDAGVVGLEVDAAHDTSPMNAGLRMARIAAGAAFGTFLRTAWSNGWSLEAIPGSGRYAALVRIDDPRGPAGESTPPSWPA